MPEGRPNKTMEISTVSQSERVAIVQAVEVELGNRKGSNQYQSKVDTQNFAEAKGKESSEIAAKK